VRASIVQLLAQYDLSSGEIAARYPIGRPTVSRHLGLLLKSHLVSVRSEANRRVYSIDVEGIKAVSAWIDQYRANLDNRLENSPEAQP